MKIRKKSIVVLLSAFLVGGITLVSCNSNSNNKSELNSQEQADSVLIKKDAVVSFVNPIEGYFSKIHPEKKIEASLDSIQFEKDFQFAATMDNSPAKIDFSKEKVGAIVLPETSYETNITIQTAQVVNSSDTLVVTYTVKEGTEKQTYSTIPVKLFAYNKKFTLVFDQQK